ncbi:MAG: histone deacetylase [Archaeoglobaceae archaeon]
MSSLGWRTGLIYHQDFLLHEHSSTHPERRERLMYTMDQLEEEGIFELPEVEIYDPQKATMDDLLMVHSKDYINRLAGVDRGLAIDREGETIAQDVTFEQARLAAGGAILGGELVVEKDVDHSFVMARPPGHHASASHGHGFCFLNNTAIMIRYLQETYDVKKVLIWDWDAHHFDGTQSIFYEDPSVLTISTHQSGKTLFPGTGFIEEVGLGAGEGYNVNVPLPPGTSDEGYLKVVNEIFIPMARDFEPDVLVVEAGQDNHFTDPITMLDLTAQGYAQLMDMAVDMATELCDDKLVAVLEGGYGVEGGLPYTNLAVMASLAGLDTSSIREPENYKLPDRNANMGVIEKIIGKVKEVHTKYHQI